MNRMLKGSELGLVAYWRFDEKDGSTTSDRSGHHHDGTLASGVKRIPSPFQLQ